ncbi:transcriptional regulator [Paenibacillus selenitireducens]|jgi:Rrf2 family protein|uniref:Transcriptional regulator n=1 Tax=Paenibacillus selenitireducens TaxID=1324314 RepID=A0A1T2X0Q8_9BACL|nr:Rrf2 family transcriptional regulator [Paenibacillus selenitireducens]OPA73385.1 transcriptional regulator [Paenibacillus selenitireducens]
MAQLKRFGFGVQALIVLASNSEQCSSAEIANQIRCEPTALRKILSQLAEAGIVQVKQGRAGGYQLARNPEEITLFEVYTSLHEEEPIWDRMLDTTGNHLFGQKMHGAFQKIMTDISTQVGLVLGTYTIADMME